MVTLCIFITILTCFIRFTSLFIHKDRRSVQPHEPVECVVCLCEMAQADEVGGLRCGHVFHRICLERWLEHRWRSSCPLCKDDGLERSLVGGRRAAVEEVGGVAWLRFSPFGDSDACERWWLR
ncbi:putative E3 ubiquitin-protein ligase RHA2B [Acorus calamus]|uniref:E3 ubiquitin-protein ligase RHA2B n=1 Tax=Acorus calamus TaxID=4465 RepID=A0AAV9ESK9_ACOCL|nr:putative E3 ubiquitin-protein ligase RHA2B [Acorus calamus]